MTKEFNFLCFPILSYYIVTVSVRFGEDKSALNVLIQTDIYMHVITLITAQYTPRHIIIHTKHN
jgi:hypothetical protein